MHEPVPPNHPFLAQAGMGMLQSDAQGRILAEPFLFIGLIAIVRRVLVLVAEVEVEHSKGRSEITVIEMSALGGLALVLMLSIYLPRRSSALGARVNAC
jgi:hypothetical protein